MLKLTMVKTLKGNYVTKSDNSTYSVGDWYKYILFNKQEPVPAFKNGWIYLIDDLKEIGRMQSQPNTNYRYELIDKNFASDKLKEVFERDEISYCDSEGYRYFKNEYKAYESLYKLLSDPQPEVYKPIEFEITKTVEFNNVVNVEGFSYPAKTKAGWSSKMIDLTKENVTYDLLTELCVPDIARESFPCSLTSKQSYEIVRKYIQDHIDPKVAKITSDYDFCFTVKKKIEKVKSEKYVYDENAAHNMFNKRKRKPKYKTAYRESREIEVFEMTHTEDNYKGYTPISGFKANSLTKLKETIDNYLDGVIKVINEPLRDCPNCEGTGVIITKNK